jgi:hypothetical protein
MGIYEPITLSIHSRCNEKYALNTRRFLVLDEEFAINDQLYDTDKSTPSDRNDSDNIRNTFFDTIRACADDLESIPQESLGLHQLDVGINLVHNQHGWVMRLREKASRHPPKMERQVRISRNIWRCSLK